MTEEFVTLETAKLLKEKGFNEYCKNVIDIGNILNHLKNIHLNIL